MEDAVRQNPLPQAGEGEKRGEKRVFHAKNGKSGPPANPLDSHGLRPRDDNPRRHCEEAQTTWQSSSSIGLPAKGPGWTAGHAPAPRLPPRSNRPRNRPALGGRWRANRHPGTTDQTCRKNPECRTWLHPETGRVSGECPPDPGAFGGHRIDQPHPEVRILYCARHNAGRQKPPHLGHKIPP